MTRLLNFLLISAYLLVSHSAYALKTDKDQPIDITADHLVMNEQKQISTYTGNVTLIQGSLNIQGDTLILYFDAENNLEYMELTGAPARLKQLDEQQNLISGHAEHIKYEDQKSLLSLSKNAQFKSGKEHINSSFIQINTETDHIQAGTQSPNERVHIKILPRQQ